MTKNRFYIQTLFFSLVFLTTNFGTAQYKERPFIWAEKKDKVVILKKIETEEWAASFYKKYIDRLFPEIKKHQNNKDAFLSEFPFDLSLKKQNTIPPLRTFLKFDNSNHEQRKQIANKLKIAVDSGVLYFLTDDKKYAQCALDLLHTILESISQVTPSANHRNGGWIYPDDHLREARVIGAQIPIIYDFVYPYLKKGGKPYDIALKSEVEFNYNKAQNVFRTYARLAIEHGHRGSNWSVLEATSLVRNSLALDDPEERRKMLHYFLKDGSNYQESLPEVAERYKNEGDVYPETSQYSNGVASIMTQLMVLLSKYDPALDLGNLYYKISWSLDTWDTFRYPNNEIVRFGDGHRTYDTNYISYEMAYALGKIDSVSKLLDKFGPLIANGIQKGDYKRDQLKNYYFRPKTYETPLRLLWFSGNFEKSGSKKTLPRTVSIPHAGIYIQRNVSTSKNPKNDLMCFVGGGHYVHGHANGMDMELYGQGLVMGVDGGRGKYRTELHENYSRLYAAHNTVVVNGASRGEGGWVNLGIHTTERIAMEPLPLEKALSPKYSFTRTRFKDDKGTKTKAIQQRTLAIVRTSPKTGYYVDVFRSKSEFPKQYHDYIYHNIGDELQFLNQDIAFYSDPNRYQENAYGEWIHNKKYRNPGWHYFTNVKTSQTYYKDVKAQFRILNHEEDQIVMNLFIPGTKNRTYTKVLAPPTFESPEHYEKVPTPTLVIRKKGEAWKQPFAVIYEPKRSGIEPYGITSVKKLEQDGAFKGFKITSTTPSGNITQYIITQTTGKKYDDPKLNISFEGGYAVITEDAAGNLKDVYIGDGKRLRYKNVDIKTVNQKDTSVYIDFSKKEPHIHSKNIKNLLISIE